LDQVAPMPAGLMAGTPGSSAIAPSAPHWDQVPEIMRALPSLTNCVSKPQSGAATCIRNPEDDYDVPTDSPMLFYQPSYFMSS
jgi:hypothetical protein